MIPEYGCLAFIFKGRRLSFFFSAGKVSDAEQKLGAYGKFRRCITTALRRPQSRQRAKPCTPGKKRKDGRLLNDNRTEILSFRVTPEEKEIITEKALSSCRLVSMYLRDCALGKKILAVEIDCILFQQTMHAEQSLVSKQRSSSTAGRKL